MSFRQMIVKKCQDTFELVSANEKQAAESLLEIESCGDQVIDACVIIISIYFIIMYTLFIVLNAILNVLKDFKKELKSKYDENERIQRKRSVGNCR